LQWRNAEHVFSDIPGWIGDLIPADTTDLWAPDVSRFGGTYHLYYAASTWGTGRSCIGHATTDSLTSPAWEDRGSIVCSDLEGDDVDDWDAIDPSTITDTEGTRWMVFGSFGSGIKLIRLNDDGERASEEFYSLAQRPEEVAIQAPFLFYRAPYYYLFASFDRCCAGVNSTYNIRVGRSEELTGPYVDAGGVPMLQGGGTFVLQGNERWPGVGANTLITTQGRDFNIYHGYDANAAGRATLRISEVVWDGMGWPVSAGP
jgi:arabinan endo-1,5-alpha-L-arabinosidase